MGISGEEKDFVERTAKALAEFNKRGYPAICGIGWGAIRTIAISHGFKVRPTLDYDFILDKNYSNPETIGKILEKVGFDRVEDLSREKRGQILPIQKFPKLLKQSRLGSIRVYLKDSEYHLDLVFQPHREFLNFLAYSVKGKIQNVPVPILSLYQAVYGKITASRTTLEKNDIQDIISVSPLIEKICSKEEIQLLYETAKEKNCQELVSCFEKMLKKKKQKS
jgi:hypothetical protein